MLTLSNEFIEAKIKHLGAELCSLKKTGGETEYIWDGNPSIWGRHAPVLFPIVGKLKDNQYTYQGKKYTMAQHGFARDREFSLTHQDAHKISFTLLADEKSLAVYPFPFKLEITYTLKGKVLVISYGVTNTGDSTMYFGIGAHPGFAVPPFKDESIDSYSLKFEKNETLGIIPLAQGLLSGTPQPFLTHESTIKLSDELFNNDALIFENYTSSFLSIVHQSKGELIRFHCKGFPYLGIWSKPGPFVCIEPWYGIADTDQHDGRFENKRGIQRLQLAGTFTCAYSIELI